MHSRVIHDSSWRVNHSSLARETGRGLVVRTWLGHRLFMSKTRLFYGSLDSR
jgi:hypothetical protein